MKPYLELAKQVLEIEKEALDRVSQNLGSAFEDAIEVLMKSLQDKGKIVVVGVGKSGNIGNKIAATFNSTGATAVVLSSQDALHGDLGLISEGDVILAMSYSGETPELLNLLPHMKHQGTPIIALTSKPESTLGQNAHLVLDSSVAKEACPLNLAPTSSSTAMLALGDALAMVLLDARGFTKEDFARYHPGGSLGKALLTSVRDIMRGESAVPKVSENASVLDTLREMSEKKAGICLVLEGETLSGILTHGDFVRLYTVDHNAGDKPIREVMTQNPVTIEESLLAVEAVNLLREHRIDDLVVVNESGSPVGIIDSQDLAKHKLL